MYYGYNSFTGRLIGANRMKAYSPQGLQPLGPGEPINPYPPNFIKATPSTPQGKAVPARAASGHAPSEYGKVPERVLKIRARLQKAEHLPVHLKGGPLDYVLFYLTAGLAVTGMTLAVHTIYKLSFPKPVEN